MLLILGIIKLYLDNFNAHCYWFTFAWLEQFKFSVFTEMIYPILPVYFVMWVSVTLNICQMSNTFHRKVEQYLCVWMEVTQVTYCMFNLYVYLYSIAEIAYLMYMYLCMCVYQCGCKHSNVIQCNEKYCMVLYIRACSNAQAIYVQDSSCGNHCKSLNNFVYLFYAAFMKNVDYVFFHALALFELFMCLLVVN